MIDLKTAIKQAKEFITELNGEPQQFQVEEVSLSNDERKWSVTVSYMQKINEPNDLQEELAILSEIKYKKVEIDNNNNSVIGMFNWSLDRAV
jgi:hypothetical protein